MRQRGLRATVLLLIGACALAVLQPLPASAETEVHPNGITILRGEIATPDELPAAVAQRLVDANLASEQDAGTLSYPFLDAKTDQVVVTAVTESAARSRVDRFAAAGAPASSYKVKRGKHSRRTLDTVMDRVIGRQPEGLVVGASYPDPANNRVVVEVGSVVDAFLYRLAREHDPSTLAVRVVDDDVQTAPAARESDRDTGSGFWGGAHIDPSGCTTGFSWHSGSTQMMLTAGHCYPATRSVSTPVESMGRVTGTSEESWNTGTGTVRMSGESVYRGDLALIRLASGKNSGPNIYRGGFNSSSSINVVRKWHRSPAQGDRYCTGGRVSGEQCGWAVGWSAAGNYTYTKTGEVARRVWRGTKKGKCIIGGDSGGPVYTIDSAGSYAKGIISGATGYGGSDNSAGTFESACVSVFTDIWDAYYSMPGDIN